MSRKTKNNPVLVGDAGVGKTALALGLAQQIANGDVPAEMAKMRVLELDLMNVVAGTRFRGDFEERMNNIIKDIEEDGKCSRSLLCCLHDTPAIRSRQIRHSVSRNRCGVGCIDMALYTEGRNTYPCIDRYISNTLYASCSVAHNI